MIAQTLEKKNKTKQKNNKTNQQTKKRQNGKQILNQQIAKV